LEEFYGWGRPNCWQGWVVLSTWIVCFTAASFLLPKHFIACGILLTAVLLVIVYIKGEKPLRWRWGKKE